MIALCFGAGALSAKRPANRIYAQQLVDQLLADRPDLLVVGLHVTAPGAAQNTMIACNLDRIGKVSDEDDLKVVTTNAPISESAPGRFEVLLPLHDRAGKTLGALAVVFMAADGGDTSKFVPDATAIRDGLAASIPTLESLFDPATPDGLLLRPADTMEIPGAAGKFDFLEIDPVRHRLLGAHEKSGTADFFDLNTYLLLARVPTGPAVHVASDQAGGKYFISASEDKKVVVVDAVTLKETGEIPTEGELDAIVMDPKNRRVYVTNDEGSHVWVIDADSQKVVATIDIPGAPEYMIYDGAADRIYLNIKATNEILAIDPTTNAILSHWPTAPATKPHGLAFDPESGWLFAAGANGQLAAIDSKTGKLVGSAAIAPAVDQAVFDPSTKRIYCACTGVMSVVQETADGLAALGNVKSADTAKNVAVDPATHAVWTTFTDGKNSYAKSWLP